MDARVLAAALGQKATVLEVKGELYAAQWFDVGWWVWALEENAKEYFVDHQFRRCTCPMWQRHKSCKHIQAIKHGNVRRS